MKNNKAVILSESGYLNNNSYPDPTRPLGAHTIAEIYRKHNFDVLEIDYAVSWVPDVLTEYILNFTDSADLVHIGISVSLCIVLKEKIKQVITKVKSVQPDTKIIVGGVYTVTDDLTEYADMIFCGRSEVLFDMYLNNNLLINNYKTVEDNTDVYTWDNKKGISLQCPQLYKAHESQMCQQDDVLGFELAVGCKFNCAFCNYSFRASPRPKLINPNALAQIMQYNYDRYSVTHYTSADDTLNEVDDKLVVLAEAVSKLSFVPHIASLIRLDVLKRRPHQLELLKAANVCSQYYGIETLNTTASKHIGKNSEGLLDTTDWIRSEWSDCYSFGNFIVGLEHDSRDSLWYFAEEIIKRKSLSGASYCNLAINPANYNIDSPLKKYSALDATPERYGFTIDQNGNWCNLWINEQESIILARELTTYIRGYMPSKLTAFLYNGLHALGAADIHDQRTLIDNEHNRSVQVDKSRHHINNYINKKLRK